LVVGRRTNVRGNDKLLRYLPGDVTELAKKKGQLFMFSAIDYFIMTSTGYPWHRVPRDVVVGRVGYDNFLVLNALRHRVSVVDATNTITALHQTGRDGNMAGHGGKYAGYNIRQLGRFNFRGGLTSSSQFVTKYANDTTTKLTTVELEKRVRKKQTGRSRSDRSSSSSSLHTATSSTLSQAPAVSTLSPRKTAVKRSG